MALSVHRFREHSSEEYTGLFPIPAGEIKTHTAEISTKTVLVNRRQESKGRKWEGGAEIVLPLNFSPGEREGEL